MKTTKIDFMGNRRFALLISGVFILASLLFLMVRGLNLGIDFTGGNLVQVEFEKDVSVAEVRETLAKSNQGNAVIQAYNTKGVIIRIAADKEEDRKVLGETLKASFPGAKVVRFEKVGPVVGSELRREAVIALCIALVGILLYITVRFQFRFAVVSVLALLHDAIITLGAFSLSGMEVSSTFIAAILTIVGYSLNDTIVVLDRIRENWKNVRSRGILEVLNESVNETLSRTINTSLTTLLPVFALFFMGGPVVRPFSFAMLIGIVVGTYSSIFIAAALLAEWSIRSPQKV